MFLVGLGGRRNGRIEVTLGARISNNQVFSVFLFLAFLRARELSWAVEAARPAGKIEPTGIRWDTERSVSQQTV